MTETELERIIVRVVADVQKAVAGIKQVETTTRKMADSGESATKSFGDAIKNLGTKMSNMAGQFQAFNTLKKSFDKLKESIAMATEFEELESNFKVLLQSAALGKQTVKDLSEFAANTPMNLPELVQGTKQLLQFGIQADEIIPTIKMLGDVALGNAQRFQSLVYAYGQVQSMTRLMGGELMQLRNAGFDPLAEIARTSGKTIAELRDEMEKGGISADQITEAFKSATSEGGRFKDGMLEASKTLAGLTSTMQDDVGALLRAVGQSLIDMLALKDRMIDISNAAKEALKWFNELEGGMQELVSTVAALALAFGPLLIAWKVGAIAVGIIIGVITDMYETFVMLKGAIVFAVAAVYSWITALVGAQGAVAALHAWIILLNVATVAFKVSILGVALYALIELNNYIKDELMPSLKELEETLKKLPTGAQREEKTYQFGRQIIEEYTTGFEEDDTEGRKKALQEAIGRIQLEAAGAQRALDAAKKELGGATGMHWWSDSDARSAKEVKKAIEQNEGALKGYQRAELEAQKQLMDLNREIKKGELPRDVQEFNKKLKDQVDFWGMDADAIEVAKFQQKKYTEAQLETTRALIAQKKAHEDLEYLNKRLGGPGVGILGGGLGGAAKVLEDRIKTAETIRQEVMTPMEKAEERLKKLKEQFLDGVIGIEIYQKAVAKVSEELANLNEQIHGVDASLRNSAAGSAFKQMNRAWLASLAGAKIGEPLDIMPRIAPPPPPEVNTKPMFFKSPLDVVRFTREQAIQAGKEVGPAPRAAGAPLFAAPLELKPDYLKIFQEMNKNLSGIKDNTAGVQPSAVVTL